MLQSCGCGQVLEAWVKERTLEEVLAAMAAARVPSGAAVSPSLPDPLAVLRGHLPVGVARNLDL